MQLDIPSILFLFGGLQALVLLIGINLNKPFYSDLKKVTSLVLFNILLITCYYFLLIQSLKVPFASVIGNISWMSLTPLYYLLVKSLSKHDWSLSIRDLIYFVLPFIFLLEAIFAFCQFNIWSLVSIDSRKEYLDLWMILFFSSALVFLTKSLILIHSSEEQDRNRDITWFTYLFLGTILTFTVIYLFVRNAYVSEFELSLIGLLSIFVLVLIYRVFRVLSFQKFFDQKKYKNQSSTNKDLQLLANKLELVMIEQKPFLDANLSLSILSKSSNISSNELSQLFNLYYDSNFYEFINRYRVDHIEKLILDETNSHFKISALAEQSGFKSKATFYKAFKEKHQLTPSQFIKRHRN